MRGGRNKFGPMYKRDRALKQQKKAIIRATSGPGILKMETSPEQHDDFEQSASVTPLSYGHGSARCGYAFPAVAAAPPSAGPQSEFEHRGQFTESPGGVPLPCSYPAAYVSRGIKSEHGDPYADGSPDAYLGASPLLAPPPPAPRAPPPDAAVPQLLAELMRCEPDEETTRARVTAQLQQDEWGVGGGVGGGVAGLGPGAGCLNAFAGAGAVGRARHAGAALASHHHHHHLPRADHPSAFALMCKMADQTLFTLVEWARSSVFFRELKVDDQMKLLQSCWSDLLVMDHIQRQVQHGTDGAVLLVTGQQVDLFSVSAHASEGLQSLLCRAQELVSKLRSLHVDSHEFVCLKYLLLFNPDVKFLENQALVENVQEQVNAALLEYTLCRAAQPPLHHHQHQHQQHGDKFAQLLLRLPEIRSMSIQAEDYLYCKHVNGEVPCNNLLIEMLHAKQA
ncbi:unnamed protein product [Lampetra planeri]